MIEMPVEVELDVFSGRPNPKWTLEPRLEAELRDKLNSLPSDPRGHFPEPPGLGYRGFFLKAGNESIRVFGGAVKTGDEIKKDPARALEKWLMETAAGIDRGLLDAIKSELS
jgi:hypothetical protein